MVEWLKKAPTAVVVSMIVVCGVLALGVLGTFALLSINGVDTTEFRQWINTVGQLIVFPLLGISTVASVTAARSASNAEDQTNGQLTARDEKIEELSRRLRDQDAA